MIFLGKILLVSLLFEFKDANLRFQWNTLKYFSKNALLRDGNLEKYALKFDNKVKPKSVFNIKSTKMQNIKGWNWRFSPNAVMGLQIFL